MRILTVTNHLDALGGLERTQLTNCGGLASRGHEVALVYVKDGSFTPDWRAITSSMTPVATTLPRRSEPLRSSRAVVSSIRRARRLGPDVVYVYRYWDIPYAVGVATGLQAAVVYHLCLPPPEPVPRWLRPFLTRVDTTISVSRHTLELWEGTGLRIERATVALTSVDLDTFAPAGGPEPVARARSELGLGPGDFVVLFAGRISPDKGIDVLVEAAGDLVEREPETRLVVLGSPPPGTAGAGGTRTSNYMEHLRRLARGLPVTFVPRRSDVLPLLQAADVAVVPSRWPEPLSRSILEPLACGIPVVATDVGGSAEVLTGWLADLLVPPDDPGELADRLASLHHWRRRDPSLGARCRRFAEETLAPDDELDLVEAGMRRATGAADG